MNTTSSGSESPPFDLPAALRAIKPDPTTPLMDGGRRGWQTVIAIAIIALFIVIVHSVGTSEDKARFQYCGKYPAASQPPLCRP